ncbi:Acyl dehydratase [Pseudonocardia thermophila]|uniref:Acyl dehydratase n=1 Tax=Pseudonocardia thermophila TaxID=1848 RepID=A0A1M7AU33_PSETH|nr:MaoC/PaaZ C-terminal domain-containing protein [Pseudonocardia thermophila]SHL46167.1 Acyl dehydratase [Pseudonocardia thermophila]
MTTTSTPIEIGQSRTTVVVENLARTQIVQYAGASGDFNPLHTDEVYAREAAGYPTVFAHGMLTMGLVGRAVTDWVGEDRLLTYGARFTAQVWPGDTLTATVTVESVTDGVAHLAVEARNQDGATVLSGTATARI